jgi:hypothetical protein
MSRWAEGVMTKIAIARDDRMTFVGMSLREAIEAFTQAAYGERLTFDHA